MYDRIKILRKRFYINGIKKKSSFLERNCGIVGG